MTAKWDALVAGGGPAGSVVAADVYRLPERLSHYGYVLGLDAPSSATRRTVKMSASESGIPVTWTSVQELYPSELRITYHHMKGATRGMQVEGQLCPLAGGTHASIDHSLDGGHWWMRDLPAHFVTGRIFLSHIADRTLRGVKHQAEAIERRGRAG
jgi:hypothetical protein